MFTSFFRLNIINLLHSGLILITMQCSTSYISIIYSTHYSEREKSFVTSKAPWNVLSQSLSTMPSEQVPPFFWGFLFSKSTNHVVYLCLKYCLKIHGMLYKLVQQLFSQLGTNSGLNLNPVYITYHSLDEVHFCWSYQ